MCVYIKEDIFNVKLVKKLVGNDNHIKEKMNNVDLFHNRKSITVVETINLSVSLS